MRIGLDVMGGDFAPDAVIEGAVDALPLFAEGDRLVLIGDLAIINNKLEDLGTDPSHFEIVHASQVIEMGDSPSKAFTHKPDSSIVVGYKLLADKEIDGFCSAGNTGAMLVGASHTVNVIPGVLRPALAALVPRLDGKRSILLDAGLNPDCKVDVLAQYGVLGTIFAKNVLGVENPTVKLLNI
jgi:glycerol-3-phosphate acyltransferase PlsX